MSYIFADSIFDSLSDALLFSLEYWLTGCGENPLPEKIDAEKIAREINITGWGPKTYLYRQSVNFTWTPEEVEECFSRLLEENTKS